MIWKQMTARTFGDVVCVDLKGNMCLCGEDELPAFVAHLLERGFLKFVLNLREVPYIDSSGFGGLVHAYTTVARRSGTLVLLHVHARIRELFRATKFTPFFETFDSEEEALRALRGSVATTS